MKRIFLIVLDSFGIGEMPDAANYGDEGSNTLGTVAKSPEFSMPNMAKLGLFNIDGVTAKTPCAKPEGIVARMTEQSAGKDTTTGHWEIAGLISKKPMPTFPNGFPQEFLEAFSKAVGRKVLCNRPYSGTQVIQDYGDEHMQSGALIVYTSADSVFQIAAHEDVVPVEELKINAIPCQSKDFTHTHASSKCNNKKCICLTAFGCFKKNINFLIT